MSGIRVFTSIEEALHAGFELYDRTANGYLVRMRTSRGWALAQVDLRKARERRVAS